MYFSIFILLAFLVLTLNGLSYHSQIYEMLMENYPTKQFP